MSLGPEAHYLAQLRAGHFLLQRCTACRQHIFYPRIACPHCDSDQLEWTPAQGSGTVYAVTTVRLDPKKPYNVSLVDLDEGVRMMGTVSGVAPDAVAIGMRVQARIETTGESARVVFDPAGAAA